MSNAATLDNPPAEKHVSFFRQSGWLMIANIAGGGLAMGVHLLNNRIPPGEYSVFVTLLMVTAFLPTMPLQMIFAQQTASAVLLGRERQLAAMIRRASLGITAVWLVVAAVVMMFQAPIMHAWGLKSSWALVATLVAVLGALLTPMFTGVLQGRQDFLWMGWAAILGAFARVAVAVVLVLGFGSGAAGMMLGACLGAIVGLAICLWRSRALLQLPGEAFDGKGLWKQIWPLMLGFGVCQFMFTTDTIYAQTFFPSTDMARYAAAGTLSRALLWLVLPLAAVMFPKLVQSTAKAEKNNLFNVVILGTAVLAACGAFGLWLVGPIVIKTLFKSLTPDAAAHAVALLPWYAGAMIPLALANVMANDLLARGRFKVVPFMVIIGLSYAFALPLLLKNFPGRMEVVLQTLGGFNLLLFAVCGWFTWIKPAKTGTTSIAS